MKPISPSSNNSPAPDSGATDSLWRPSWWRWLISALSGTVETEKQIAWLKKNNAELRQQNEKLAELESKLNEIFALLSFLADPSDENRQKLAQVLALLNEYGDTLS